MQRLPSMMRPARRATSRRAGRYRTWLARNTMNRRAATFTALTGCRWQHRDRGQPLTRTAEWCPFTRRQFTDRATARDWLVVGAVLAFAGAVAMVTSAITLALRALT